LLKEVEEREQKRKVHPESNLKKRRALLQSILKRRKK
jgi:hypothetical protein